MRRIDFIAIFFLILSFIGCNDKQIIISSPEYLVSLESWKEKRYDEVTRSWVPLVGLEWIEEGENTFGSDSSNKIIFPPSSPMIGKFHLYNDTVRMTINEDLAIMAVDSTEIIQELIVNESKTFRIENIEWTVIKRSGKHAVRIWNRSLPVMESFKLEYFDPDPEWVIPGNFEHYPEGKTYPIADVWGSLTDTPIPGRLTFKIDGQHFSLDVLEGTNDTWFVIFGDNTNGEQTYGAGRYMYVNKAGKGMETILDFNKSYNPPCAFTEYATCPLPPPQNRLPFSIQAGEIYTTSD